MLREESLFTYNQDPEYVEEMKSLFQSIKSNPKEHIKNRNINYSPLPLHEAIRNDNLDSFKSILTKNKYDINHQFDFSFYENSFNCSTFVWFT